MYGTSFLRRFGRGPATLGRKGSSEQIPDKADFLDDLGGAPLRKDVPFVVAIKNYKLYFKTNLLSLRFGRDPLRKKEGLMFGYLNAASFQRFKRYLPTNAQAFFLGDLGVSPVTHERIAFQNTYRQK